MKANRFHIGEVIQEINSDYFDVLLMKKAKDKSIYNFIQWRHLLTKGNTASFYDYQQFINRNSNYPRINRIKYLAEHKLSNDKISPKKIIDWFGENEPLSGGMLTVRGVQVRSTMRVCFDSKKREKKNPAPTFRSGTNLTKLSLDA